MALSRRDFGLAVLAAFLWGATFPVSAVALAETPPFFFTFLRFLVAAAFVFFVPRPDVPWRVLIGIGLFLGIGQYGLMFVAMTLGVPAGLASLLIHTQALFTIALAAIIFSERLTFRQVLAIGLAALGLVMLIVDRSESAALVGLGLMLAAATCGAGGNILLKGLGRVDMLGVAVWMSVVSPLPLLALSLVLEADGSIAALMATLSWRVLAAAFYSAVLATVFAYAIWGRLFVTYEAARVAPFFLLVPIFGISLSVWLLGERLSAIQIFGAALIFGGLALSLRQPKT
ncbi:MAG: EamA family transporter [Pseudomonadota bacterium]